MIIFILIIISSIWILYNFLTMIVDGLPYLNLYNGNNAILEVFNVIAIRWSPVMGLMLLLIGILGIVFINKDKNNFSGIKYPAFIIGILFSVALLL